MFCPKCSVENEDDATFCKKCGADLHLEETIKESHIKKITKDLIKKSFKNLEAFTSTEIKALFLSL